MGGSRLALTLRMSHVFHNPVLLALTLYSEPGEVVVARSIEIGHPIVYVAMNYRLSGERLAQVDDHCSSDAFARLRVPGR